GSVRRMAVELMASRYGGDAATYPTITRGLVAPGTAVSFWTDQRVGVDGGTGGTQVTGLNIVGGSSGVSTVTSRADGSMPQFDDPANSSYLWADAGGTERVKIFPDAASMYATVINVKGAAYGAKGDGTTNDTTALNNATANGGIVYVPDGTYLCDGWTISKRTHLIFSAGAVLKQRVAPTLTGGVGASLLFTTGSDGSIIENARINGNRDALSGSFTPGTSWIGLRVEYVNDVSIIGGEFFNCMCFGVYVTGTSDTTPSTQIVVRDVYVHNSAQVFSAVAVQDSLIENVRGLNISNTGYQVYQHGFEFRVVDRTDIRGLYLKNFYPDINGQDNLSLGID